MNEGLKSFLIGAFASTIGGITVAYYLGDQETRTKINMVLPFLLIGVVVASQAYGKIR